jgi:hypothetical protein
MQMPTFRAQIFKQMFNEFPSPGSFKPFGGGGGEPYADVNDKSAEMRHTQVITAVNSSSLHVVLLYKVF